LPEQDLGTVHASGPHTSEAFHRDNMICFQLHVSHIFDTSLNRKARNVLVWAPWQLSWWLVLNWTKTKLDQLAWKTCELTDDLLSRYTWWCNFYI